MIKQAKKKSSIKKVQYRNILSVLREELGKIQIRRIFKVAAAGFIFEFILFVSYFSYLDFKASAATNQAIKQAIASSDPASDAFSTMVLNDSYVEQGGMFLKGNDGDSGPQEAEFVPGEVIVKFKTTQKADEAVSGKKTAKGTIDIADDAKLKDRFEKHKISKAEKISKKKDMKDKSDDRDKIVKLNSDDPAKEETKKIIEDLKNDPNVEYAEPNYIVKTQMIPNDPYYATSGAWGQDFRDLWGLQNIQAESTWDTTQGEGVIVAVSDTGVDYNHEDIAENIWTNMGEAGIDSQGKDKKTNGIDDDNNGYIDDWHGYNFVTIDGTPADNDPMDDHGHGTHVAGTIAAVGNNNIGIIGVSPKAKIMPIKGLSGNGSGSIADLVNTIYYAADNGAQVINCSWGGYGQTPQALIDVINYAHDVKGVTIVAAAGNSNSDVGSENYGFFPASIRNVITVSAINHNNTKASFSNYGVKIDVAAPGGGDIDPTKLINTPLYSILSLKSFFIPTSWNPYVIDSKYIRLAGTSMASPHAAGVAALIKSYRPEFSPEQVRQALRAGSDDLGPGAFDTIYGNGKINTIKAIEIVSPLEVHLLSPTASTFSGSNIDIKGIVKGDGLSSWKLEYSKVNTPLVWNTINSGISLIGNEAIMGWDITNIADGSYFLRLTAQKSDGKEYADYTQFVIDRISIIDPPVNAVSIARSGKVIDIKGTIATVDLKNFTFKIVGSKGAALPNPIITLVNNGAQKIQNDLLGSWDTTGVAADMYKVMLDVALTDGSVFTAESFKIIIDPSLHEGWPKSINPYGPGNGVYYGIVDHFVNSDIDGDGDNELVVAYGTTVRVFQHTGEQLSGWPQSINQNNVGAIVQFGPVVGDLTGDRRVEIAVVTNDNKLFIWKDDGTLLPGWPKSSLAYLFNSFSIADINGDGVNEIIAINGVGQINVFNKDGVALSGWPKLLNLPGIKRKISVADINKDGKKEIVVVNSGAPKQVYLLNFDGQVVAGWPKTIDTQENIAYIPYPVLGDFDGNGDLEIIIGTTDGKVYAFNRDGSIVTGWPQSVVNGYEINSLVLGDVDGDGRIEVVANTRPNSQTKQSVNSSSQLYVWHGDGSLLSGWPQDSRRFVFYDPALIDVNNDGRMDIIVLGAPDGSGYNGNLFYNITAFQSDGSEIKEFSKLTYAAGHVNNTPSIGDFDNDGLMEISSVDAAFVLYLWDTNIPTSAHSSWSMFQHDPQRSGALIDSAKPLINIISPKNNSTTGKNASIEAKATDDIGITRVEFYVDGLSHAVDVSMPYSAVWDASALSNGTLHVVSAKAYDAAGNSATTEINVIIDNIAPVVSISSPQNQATLSGIISIEANASDNNGVEKNEFYMDNTFLGSSTVAPYVFSLNTKIKTNGVHTFFAKAYDAVGNSTVSQSVISIIDNSPPSAPGNLFGALTASIQPYLTWKASSDNSAVSGYKIYRDNQLLDSISSATLNYTDAGASVGQTYSYSISSIDAAGNESIKSNPISVNVVSTPANQNANTNNSVAQNINSSPPLNQNSNFNANISMNRNTNVSVNNNANISSRNNANANQGGIANNNAGNSANANSSANKDIAPPTVSIISPASSNKVAKKSIIVLKASATDDVKVEKVEFYANGRLLCSDDSSEYSCDWKVSVPGNPAYDIQAKAYDASGNASESEIVKLSLKSDSGVIVSGSGGSEPVIRILQSGGSEVRKFLAYERQFRGGVSVRAADLDNDGKEEIVTAPGKGREPEVRIFDFNGKRIDQFLAYGKSFKGGINIAVADFEGDGNKEIIASPQSGSPRIMVFGKRGGKWKQITPSFLAFSSKIKTGINIISGDFDGDGKDEIAATPGRGSISQVKVFGLRGDRIKEVMPQFAPFGNLFKGGINLASGDINGDWKDEIIASPASQGSSSVRVFDFYNYGKRRLLIPPFFAFDKNLRSGANLGTGDFNGDGKSEIIASMTNNGQSLVRIFSNDGKNKIQEFKGFEQQATGGVRIEKW